MEFGFRRNFYNKPFRKSVNGKEDFSTDVMEEGVEVLGENKLNLITTEASRMLKKGGTKDSVLARLKKRMGLR